MSADEEQLYLQMRSQDVESLLKIWKNNDHDEWTDAAFDAVRRVLTERGVALPAQTGGDDEESEDDAPASPRTGGYFTDDGETTYKSARITSIASWAALLSKGFIVLAVLVFIIGILSVEERPRLISTVLETNPTAVTLLADFTPFVFGTFIGLFFAVALAALAEGLYVLMDIETNTRQA